MLQNIDIYLVIEKKRKYFSQNLLTSAKIEKNSKKFKKLVGQLLFREISLVILRLNEGQMKTLHWHYIHIRKG